MTEPDGLFTRRLMLGQHLKRLRGARTLREVAAFVNLSDATISRIERGKQAILPSNVRLLCQYYGVGAPEVDMLVRQAQESEDRGSLLLDSDSVPDWAESFGNLQLESVESKVFQALLVPGPLQTAAYTREIAAASGSVAVPVDRQISRRAALRKRIEEGSWTFHAILDAAALNRTVGDGVLMAEQLAELEAMCSLPNLRLQVLPVSSGAHGAMTSSFTMLRYHDQNAMNAVFVELERAMWTAEKPKDLARYGAIFDRLEEQALTPDETREWMASLGSYYRANGGSSGWTAP